MLHLKQTSPIFVLRRKLEAFVSVCELYFEAQAMKHQFCIWTFVEKQCIVSCGNAQYGQRSSDYIFRFYLREPSEIACIKTWTNFP